jgi:protein-S-isoprenylcysteine O-methyltransferase Ste14
VELLELFPIFEIGWINGWIFMAIFFFIFGIVIKTCPKDVITRLYDSKGWTKTQYTFTKLGKLCGLIHIILVIFTPLNIVSIEFTIGIIIYLIGTIGFVIAVINFKKSPLGEPITSGLYKISRNPQVITLFLVSLGTSLTIGSWTAVIVVIISKDSLSNMVILF